MTVELKACPFCGHTATYYYRHDPSGWSNEHWVCCDSDNCSASMGLEETKEEAVHMWNRREHDQEA